MEAMQFTTELNQLSGTLTEYAQRLTRNKEDANDLFQETAYKAYKYRDKWKPNSNLKAWLLTIMKNTFINDFRRRRRNPVSQSLDVALPAGAEQQTANRAIQDLQYKEVIGQIERLHEGLRIPFLMYYQGYRYHEIAEQEGLPLGTVKSRIFHARKQLKKQLEDLHSVRNMN
jgi:RNA polymerase sigma-70 factor (ECF subfamily)